MNKQNKQSIWIFGDSFSESLHGRHIQKILKEFPEKNNSIFTWPNELEKKYYVKNFSKGGSGPQQALRDFFNEYNLHRERRKDVIVLFFLSDAIARPEFHFLKRPGHASVLTKPNQLKGLEYDPTHINFAKSYFKYAKDDDFYVDKFAGALLTVADEFKKVLCWPCFSSGVGKFITKTSKINNLYFVAEPLWNIENFKEDTQFNHISRQLHVKMFNAISNWIENDTSISLL